MHRSRGALAAVLAALAAAAAAPAASATDFLVSFPLFLETGPYTPAALDVAVGDTVTFSGEFTYHPLAWRDGDFPTTSSGGTMTFPFTRPGTFRYFCTLHVDMLGSVRVPGNVLPVADFTVAPASTVTGATVTFDAGAVTDPDGTIARYEWDLDGNGVFETVGPEAAVAREYASPGTYRAGLRIVDDGHETSATAVRDVVVAARPGASGGTDGGGAGATAGGGGASTAQPTGSTATGDTDRRAPTPRLTAAGARTIKVVSSVARLGLRLDETATVSASLRRGTGSAVLGRGKSRIRRGTGALRVRLTRAGLRAVRPGRRTKLVVVLTARDGAGNARTVRRAVTLTR